MAKFHYKAITSEGKTIEGELEGRNQDAVIARLQELGQIPLQIEEQQGSRSGAVSGKKRPASKLFHSTKITQKDISIFTQELATLLNAGLPLDRAFTILIELTEEQKVRDLLSRIQEEVRGGLSFGAALEKQEGVFSRFYINMIKAGELGGAMEAVMERLADFMERSRALREQVLSALIYPMILLVVAGASIVLLLTFVVPQFASLFEDAGKALPISTQIVMGLGNAFSHYWWVLILAIGGLVWIMKRQWADPVSRLRWDARLLGWPLVGDLIAKVEMARFSRTLGTLLGNGVALLTALSIIKETLSNRVLVNGIQAVTESLKEGHSLAEPLLKNEQFPRLAVHMIRVGEETGQLETMLMKVADIYDREVGITVQRLLALLEPLMIVGLGLTIAGIIMSILVAIMSVNDLAV